MNIYILTGDIRTGKTTMLQNWCRANPSAEGILSPVIDGKRWFVDIRSDDHQLMEAAVEEKEVLLIGRFRFSQQIFHWAASKIEEAIGRNADVIVIDEIGPLELQEKGFHHALNKILASSVKNLLIIVRDSKLEEVIEKYQMKEARIARNIFDIEIS
jgi:nucleoside-triphosphatase